MRIVIFTIILFFAVPIVVLPEVEPSRALLNIEVRITEQGAVLTGVCKDISVIDKRLDLIDTKLDDLRIVVVDNKVDIAKLDARVAVISFLVGAGGSVAAMGGKWAVVRKNGNKYNGIG